MDDVGKETFRRREDAVNLYAQKTPVKEITLRTGVDKFSLYRFIDRCLESDTDGRIAGYRALIRYRHLPAQTNHDQSKLIAHKPAPGSLQLLFKLHPELMQELFDYAVHGRLKNLKTREIDPPISAIHHLFIRLCDVAKIKAPSYPFNSESVGFPAIERWVKKIRNEHKQAYAKASNSPDLPGLQAATEKDSSPQTVSRCYQHVECDGHLLDINCKITIPAENGEGTVVVKVARLWIIVLVEIMSKAVLGYSFSFGGNYSAVDVMHAVRCAMMPWKKRNLQFKTVQYREGEGLPSGVIPEAAYVCFDELHLDNAKAHLSRYFLDQLERTVGAVPVFGPFETPNSRPYVEGFNKLLEETGLHRIIGTTGSNPSDSRREKDDKNIDQYPTVEQLGDIVDLLISRINGEKGANGSDSRLDVLRKVLTRRTSLVRRIPPDLRENVFKNDMFEEGTISTQHGRPCVRFKNATYFSEFLNAASILVGRQILVVASSGDLRTIDIFLDDGTALGTLIVEKRWRRTIHGVLTRKAVRRAQRLGKLKDCDDLPLAIRAELEKNARKSKRAAAELARIRIEQDAQSDVEVENAGQSESGIDYGLINELTIPDHAPEEESYEDIEARLETIGTQYYR